MRLAAILWLVLASAAAAETVRVRSGEHSRFSRLVVELTEPAGWTLARQGQGYVLDTGRPGLAFDVSQVYRLIPRDRIASLSQEVERGRLTIGLGCDCHAVAEVHRSSWVVIDVVDGPPPDGSPFELPLSGSLPAPEAVPPQPVAAADATSPSGRRPVFLKPPPAAPAASPQMRLAPWTEPFRTAPRRPAEAPVPAEVEPPAAIAPIEAERDRLLEELARAAAQGLLEADLPDPPALDAPADPAAAAKPPAAVPAVDHVRIEAETSVDRDAGNSAPMRHVTSEGLACVADSELDIGGWGGGEGTAAAGLAERRMALVGEFDRPHPDAVLALARYYLAIGFGAEARATIEAFGTHGREAGLVSALGSVVDGTSEGLPGPLAGQAGCGGRAALWSVLAEGGPRRETPPDKPAVLAAFSALPLPMRRHLGPRLAESFLEAGDAETAWLVRNAVARAPGDHGPAHELVDARLSLAEGDPAAKDALEKLVAADDGVAPEAYAALLRAELEAGSVPDGAADTAAAFAFELPASETGAELADLAVRAILASADYEAARKEILRLEAEGASGGAALWAAFADAITRGAPDAEFLRQAFAARGALEVADLAPPVATALANRLASLAFGEEALRYLDPAASGEAERLARADALLGTARPEAALATLQGLAGTAAERLRARALMALGDARAASVGFAAAGDVAASERAAWAAGAWELLAGATTEPARTVAELRRDRGGALPAERLPEAVLGADPPVEALPPSRVEEARRRLQDLEAARAAISALLSTESGASR